MTYESITHEMIQALSDEIEAIKEGGGGRRSTPSERQKGRFRRGQVSVHLHLALNWRCLTTRRLQLKVDNLAIGNSSLS